MECGNCTLCCELLAIEQLNKPHSELCKFCLNDKCSIYSKRPEACVNFKCHYITHDNLSEELRPDKTYVIFEKVDNCDIYIATEHPEHVGAHRNQMNFINELKEKGNTIIVTSFTSAPKPVYLGKGVVKEEIDKQIKESLEAL